MSYLDLEELAARGAAFLDSVEPGWAEKIDVGSLDLGEAYHCVLGQLHGNYSAGALAYHLDLDERIRLGFTTASWVDSEEILRPLTAAWRQEVHKRQEGAA